MQAKIISKPAFTVVGLRLRATPMTPEIPALWDQFVPRMDEIPHPANEHASYGLMGNYDAAQNTFDYMAGNPVEQVGKLPAGMTSWQVPANTYAVFDATLPTLGAVMGQIYSIWFPTSGYQQGAGPNFEYYGEDFSPNHPVVSIYIPVEKKA